VVAAEDERQVEQPESELGRPEQEQRTAERVVSERLEASSVRLE
jgi:hypothetical protein